MNLVTAGFIFARWHRKRLLLLWCALTVVLWLSDRSAAVLKVGGGAAVRSRVLQAGQSRTWGRRRNTVAAPPASLTGVSSSTGPPIEVRSARPLLCFISLLIARQALVAAGGSAALCLLSVGKGSCVWFYRRAPDIPQSVCAAAAASVGMFSIIKTVSPPKASVQLCVSFMLLLSLLLLCHSQINRQKEKKKLRWALQLQGRYAGFNDWVVLVNYPRPPLSTIIK